jgi:hypothetical protein
MPREPGQKGLIDDEDFVEGIEESDETPDDELSESELLHRYMAAMSFKPQRALHDAYMEFFKTYSDPSGRSARALAVIKKDTTGLNPERPEYFTITVQLHIPASIEDVEKRAPSFVRPDLLRVLAAFSDVEKRRNEVAKVLCDGCRAQTHDFTAVAGRKLCNTCLLKELD